MVQPDKFKVLRMISPGTVSNGRKMLFENLVKRFVLNQLYVLKLKHFRLRNLRNLGLYAWDNVLHIFQSKLYFWDICFVSLAIFIRMAESRLRKCCSTWQEYELKIDRTKGNFNYLLVKPSIILDCAAISSVASKATLMLCLLFLLDVTGRLALYRDTS